MTTEPWPPCQCFKDDETREAMRIVAESVGYGAISGVASVCQANNLCPASLSLVLAVALSHHIFYMEMTTEQFDEEMRRFTETVGLYRDQFMKDAGTGGTIN